VAPPCAPCQPGLVADFQFSDARLAALYDAFCPWDSRDDFRFYLPMVMSARAVLDVGCGTGALLHAARQSGHAGRLCGLDPAAGMLAQARQRTDIEWVQGDLASAAWPPEFDLVIMTGHAFQVLVTDDELRASLTAARSALASDGCFVFETRNPLARAWQNWTPHHAVRVRVRAADDTGAVVQMAHEVQAVSDGVLAGDGTVSFATTYTSPAWDRPQVSHSTLRFLGPGALAGFLSAAGLAVEQQFGDWDRQPLSAASPEIITVTRRA
jgi:SAM-dependent methyltransferase